MAICQGILTLEKVDNAGGQNSNLYLNVVFFFNTTIN
jgi:hypothetical protein